MFSLDDALPYIIVTMRLCLSQVDIPEAQVSPRMMTMHQSWRGAGTMLLGVEWAGLTVKRVVTPGELPTPKAAAVLGKSLADQLLFMLPSHGDNVDEWGVRYA